MKITYWGVIKGGTMEVEQLSTMLTNITTIITSIFAWVGTAASTIITTPLLIVGLAFFCLGEDKVDASLA